VEEVEAHKEAIWSLCVLPDKRGIVTGSADQKVKFWQFELVEEDEAEENEDAMDTSESAQIPTKYVSINFVGVIFSPTAC